MDIKKLVVIFAFLIFLLVSPSFAHDDNATEIPVGSNYGDVYFNSSSLSDGDGSIENPYNKITMDRINNYATLHLADGEYDVTGFKTISSLTIMGESSENTIVRHEGLLFTVLSELSINNLTLSGVTIKNQGTINSTNVIFSDSVGSSSDRYNNVFGGVFDNYGSSYVTPKLYLDNCIFRNNHADYGGAIYLINSNAFINNCLFERNIAYNYGGAIACDGSSKLTIKNTRFKFDSSTKDAGGALYIKNSSADIENSNFTNCNSTFGGAICDLNSDLSLDNVIFSSNNVLYDGGAIFKMYGSLSISDSKFNFNAANNGGAIFSDNSSLFGVQSSRFSSNSAKYCGGAIYSLLNKNSIIKSNIYTRNKANNYPNVFETDSVNLFVGNNNYFMFKYNPPVSDLPSSYSSLEQGYITPVKDQQASGNCWAFTAIATLESCILKASNITYDLSEENMKNLIELYSDYGWNMDTNNGGYDNMAIGYLASWLGPVLEENDPFDDYSTLSPVLDSIMHVQNIIFLGRDNFTDNNGIKEAIFKYGAVGTGLYYSGSYLFGDAYYYTGAASENHAVTIVGWDDDYPYYKFSNPAPANGAWIVKNSWEDNWADKGYFYVSYYDTRFARVGNTISSYTFILNDTLRYDKNYQYDVIGLTKFLSTANNEVWYGNVFNSTEDEVLTAFSTYFNAKTNWTSYVFVNDEYVFKQNGTALPGYYTFDFDDHVYLNQGDSFKIIVKLENNFASAPLSEKIYSNKVFSKKGISFLSYDGNEWYDLYAYENSPVACLKAFTIIPSISLKIKDIGEHYADEFFNITSFISDNQINGSVVYNISGMIFAVNMTDGVANLPISFNKSGNYEGSAYFVYKDKFSNKINFTIKIMGKKLDTFIKLDNITSEVDKIILVNATICDENNQLVSQGNLTLAVGNDTYVCPVENGSAVCEISFEMPGNYVIAASFNAINYNPSSKIINVKVNKSKLKSNVTLNNSIVYTGDEIKIISSVLSDNLTVDGGFAVFSINNTEYKINVSKNNAVLDVVFNQSGRYIVDVSFSHEKYDIDGCSLIVDVSDRFSRVSISDLKVYVGEMCNVSALVFDENGEIIKTGFLSFNISGVIYNIDLSNDGPVLEITFDETGCYDVFVEFYAFGYQKSSNSSVIEVSKRVLDVSFLLQIGDITLNATQKTANLTCDVDKIILVNAVICDENNQLVSQGNLTLAVGNDTYVCPVENGSAVCEILFDKCGNYVIAASFNGINYNPSSKIINVKVNKSKLKSNVTLNNSIVYTGDEIKIISNVLSDNLTVDGGFAVFSINNTEYNVNISNNKAILDIKFNQSGNYIVNVNFSHEKYDIDGCSLVVDVSDRFSRVSISDLNVYVGEMCNVSALVFDENGEIIKTGFLSFNISDEIYNIDLSKDYPVLEITFNETGCYDVLVEFYAFGYQKSSNSSVIEVSKKNLEINFTIDDIYYGDDLIINIPSDDVVDVEIVINNVKYNLKTNAEFKIEDILNAGNYDAILIFNGSDVYNSFNKKTNFTVNKLSLSANFKVENKTLFIQFSQPVNDTLSLKINNQSYIVNLTEGKSELDLSNLSMGNYLLLVNYTNPNYEDVLENYSFTIAKLNTMILVQDLIKYYKSASRYELALIDEDGNYLSNKEVIISLSNVNYKRTTNEYGKASIAVNINSGTYSVLIYFEGDEQFNSSKNSSTIIVKSTIESNNLVKYYRNASQFYATILDHDGNIVKNQVISFNINGVFYNRTTNDNGVVRLNINLSPGIYIITTENSVTGEKASNNITVLSLIVENKNLVKYYRNDSQYIVKILGDDGNPVGAGVTVRFNINGVFYERRTNESGIAKLNINLNPGVYIITAEYNGCRVSNNITVIPILTADDLTKDYGASDQFVATLVDGKGNPYAKQYVQFNINGVFYQRITDDNGQAKLNIRLMPGKYIITSAFGTFQTSNTIMIR